jgi:hypothetical protein
LAAIKIHYDDDLHGKRDIGGLYLTSTADLSTSATMRPQAASIVKDHLHCVATTYRFVAMCMNIPPTMEGYQRVLPVYFSKSRYTFTRPSIDGHAIPGILLFCSPFIHVSKHDKLDWRWRRYSILSHERNSYDEQECWMFWFVLWCVLQASEASADR